jgi:DNA-binding CsgD family transcriptional regulator/tetratricopeptide (TPR) repeat protein
MGLPRVIPSRKRFFGSRDGLASPMVGRTDLLWALTQRRPPASVLLGEAGIGKSRLLAAARDLDNFSTTFSVGCHPGAALLPMDPMIALVRALYRGGRISKNACESAVGSAERDRLWSVRDAIEAGVGGQPLTFQIDDLQFSDASSLDALRYCIDRLQDLPVTWHLAARAGGGNTERFASDLERLGLATVLTIEPLTMSEMRELAQSLAAATLSDTDLTRLVDRTGGNPLYAELLLSGGDVAGREIPRNLRTELRERLGGLDGVEKSIAGWLAVHRGALPQGALAALSQLSPGQVLVGLAALTDRGILRRTPEGYTFRHELVRDACYEVLDESVRAANHAALGERTDDEWQKAGHFDGAGRYREAATLLNRIGWDRFDCHGPSEALAACERALERLEPDATDAWEARAGIAVAFAALGRTDEAVHRMQAFEARSSLLPASLRVRARTAFAEAAWDHVQDPKIALPPLEAAMSEAVEAAPHLLPRVLYLVGAVHERRGELEKAREALERGLASCDERTHLREAIRLRSWLAVVVGRLGNAREGIEIAKLAADQASTYGLGNEYAQVCAKLCYLCDMLDDAGGYERWCRRGIAVAGPKSRRIETLLMVNLACACIDQGRLKEGLGLCVAAVKSVERGNTTLLCQAHCAEAITYAMLGDAASAENALSEAAALDVNSGWRRAIQYTEGFVAELSANYSAALECYEAAVGSVTASAGQVEVYELRAFAGVARTAALLGEREKATDAVRRLRETNRHGWQVARVLLAEAEGFFKLMHGDVDAGCDDLRTAIDSEGANVVWKTYLRLVVAERAPLQARAQISEIIDAFDALGARTLADRARGVARAHGLRPGRRREAHGELTDREATVALLVASGKTNAEIGDLLHVSAKTVEYHLSNVLTKFGMRSRVEIAARVAAGTLLGLG